MSQTNESCTRFAKLLGIEVPFLNAPMEGIATPELVAAVSEAGGLGVIPAAGLAPDEIRAFAARVKELTQKPFAVNLAVPVDAPADAAERFERFGDAVSMLLEELELPAGEGASYAERYDLEGCTRPDFFEQFDAALEVRPAAVISSFGGFREPEEEKLAELGLLMQGGGNDVAVFHRGIAKFNGVKIAYYFQTRKPGSEKVAPKNLRRPPPRLDKAARKVPDFRLKSLNGMRPSPSPSHSYIYDNRFRFVRRKKAAAIRSQLQNTGYRPGFCR